MSTGDMMTNAETFDVIPIRAPLGSQRWPRALIHEVKFIVAHNIRNPGASARGHATWYRKDLNLSWVSTAHPFVNDRDIVETGPGLTCPP